MVPAGLARRAAARGATPRTAPAPSGRFRRTVPVRLSGTCLAVGATTNKEATPPTQGIRGVVGKAVPVPASRAAAASVASTLVGTSGPGVAQSPEVAVPTQPTALGQLLPAALLPCQGRLAVRQRQEDTEPAAGLSSSVAERQAHAVLQDALAVRQPAARRLAVVTTGDAAAAEDKGPGLAEVVVLLLPGVQVMPGASVVQPMATPPLTTAGPTTPTRVQVEPVIGEAPASTAAASRVARLQRLEGRRFVVTPAGLEVGVTATEGRRTRRAVARRPTILPDAAGAAVEVLAADPADGSPVPANPLVVAVAETGPVTSMAAVAPVGRLPLQPNGTVVTKPVPTAQVMEDAEQVIRQPRQPTARTEGRTTGRPHAAVVGGAALLRHTDEAPVAGLLVAPRRIPNAAEDGPVHVGTGPTTAADTDRLAPLTPLPTATATVAVKGSGLVPETPRASVGTALLAPHGVAEVVRNAPTAGTCPTAALARAPVGSVLVAARPLDAVIRSQGRPVLRAAVRNDSLLPTTLLFYSLLLLEQ